MLRPIAIIDTQALTHNLQRVRQAAPHSRVMAVIKANGYGHGLLAVAQALHTVDAFAVARLEEALFLRQQNITKPLLLLGGVLTADEWREAVQQQVQLVIHQIYQLELLELLAAQYAPLAIWLKLDTGMHRLGFMPDQFPAVWARLKAVYPGPVVLMSHFANADVLSDETTRQQWHCFQALTRHLAYPCSLANSAAILGWPDTHQNWVRPGIMLYGASPFSGDSVAADYDLKAVMTLKSRIIAVNHYAAGERIGYGGISICPEAMRVGVVAIGYGDGYPRHAPPGTPVLLHGKYAPLLGRVSMDMIMIDLRQHPQAQPGDEVILWGQGLPAERIAQAAGTITYDLFCKINTRVHRY